jgi:hypothetical protein
VVELHCYKTVNSQEWDHVYNQATGKSGWVLSDYLDGGGAAEPC